MPAYSELWPGKRNPALGSARADSPASAARPVAQPRLDALGRLPAGVRETLSRCRSGRRPA